MSCGISRIISRSRSLRQGLNPWLTERESETYSVTARRVSSHMPGREISKILSSPLQTARHLYTQYLFQTNYVYPKGEKRLQFVHCRTQLKAATNGPDIIIYVILICMEYKTCFTVFFETASSKESPERTRWQPRTTLKWNHNKGVYSQ
jgi:hypothetical protein